MNLINLVLILIVKKNHMNQSLSSIFKTHPPTSVVKQNFSNDCLFEELIECCYFNEVSLFNCCFEGSEFLGNDFSNCSFENCTFNDTIIRKSDFYECEFKNCQFIDCRFSPRAFFIKTLFRNCRFSTVDFSNSHFSECAFLNIDLTKIKLEGTSMVEVKTKNITLKDLEFNEAQPMRLYKSNKSFALHEPVRITNSLDFQKEIEMN